MSKLDDNEDKYLYHWLRLLLLWVFILGALALDSQKEILNFIERNWPYEQAPKETSHETGRST